MLSDAEVPLQLIMAKTRHKNPRTVMRYVKPGGEAVAEITALLGPPPNPLKTLKSGSGPRLWPDRRCLC
jgi:hypothetical protein